MKLHIIGLAGSGKTTFASWAGSAFGLSAIDLDPVVYSEAGQRPMHDLLHRIDEIRSHEGWITEGAYHDDWLQPLLLDAEAIVWLDVAVSACLVRILKRHVGAELRRNNKHPGWRKLWRFLNHTHQTASQQRGATATLLHPYADKVLRCHASADLRTAKTTLMQSRRPS